ncbi:MAG: hypothetical protein IPF99_37975 [Deltaproteobacteria bacterium]|nr:hypothetical protein [Deltaproteobacteria bacterium]
MAEQDPRLWIADGWTAKVIKNNDDEGWAVEMTRDGDPEPSLVGPWTMGRQEEPEAPRSERLPTPWVRGRERKCFSGTPTRQAQLHPEPSDDVGGRRYRVDLDIAQDEDDPHAMLTAWDGIQRLYREVRMPGR